MGADTENRPGKHVNTQIFLIETSRYARLFAQNELYSQNVLSEKIIPQSEKIYNNHGIDFLLYTRYNGCVAVSDNSDG